ncbi:NAD(P)H-dependent oxidoreductase [Daejeonella sp.]|uniref:NAD(P)H-dependent oxidoreductase n=1 Tax=Daejeonella sp. TaxID=2805397 RepID=UPI0030C204AE
MNWRYATKSMNGTLVPQEKIDIILESIRLSASSIGLQPYNVLVISDRDLLEKIQPIAFNQGQITQASHLIIFAAWDKITQERVDAFISNIAVSRGVEESSLGIMRGYGDNFVAQSAEDNFKWAARQAYIALGTALVAAASVEVDSTPMEGFNTEALDELLGLKERGLKSVSILPIGYRDAEKDWLAPLKKVRTPKEELFVFDGELLVS